jgi:fatty-acyl-CoA synthase
LPPDKKTAQPFARHGKPQVVETMNQEAELLALAETLLAETRETPSAQPLTLQSSLQYHLGLDSLGRAELFRRIEKKWKIQLPDYLLVKAETLADLLAAIQEAKPSQKEDRSANSERYAKYHSQTIADVSKADTLVEVLFEHAQKTPDRPYIYLQNEKGGEDRLTYSELLTKALQVANALKHRGLKSGETVAIMQPTQLGFFYTFFGILLASGVPVPIYPPLRPHQLESYAKQEAKILNNAEIRFLVTFEQAELLSRLLQGFIPSLQAVVTVEDLLKEGDSLLIPLSVKKDNIGLIQYTSGSTSTPKGVVLTHHNLLSNIRAFGQAIAVSPQDIAVSWLPLYHDFGLIGLVLGTLYFGLPLILLSPITFLSRPEKWLWALHVHRGTISAAPNFAYELCVRKIDPENIQGLDLSSWRLAANGAETIYPKTYERFVEKFKAYGFKAQSFYPVYGLAESTVGLTVSPLNRLPRVDVIERNAFENNKLALPADPNNTETLEIISCGKPLPDHFVRIVDEKYQPLPERAVGQLQFQGPSSMRGYYNNPTATELARRGAWWNSGDFAYMVDGEVFITGRQKDLIIKAGRNIYPSVLEEIVCDLPGIRRGCVIAFGTTDKAGGTEKIVLVAETSEKNNQKKEALKTLITETLLTTMDLAPDELIFVSPRTVPKTSSGKLQRSACKALYLEGKLKPAPAWLQMMKLSLKSFLRKGLTSLLKILKLFYTLYVVLLLALATLPLWLAIKFLSPEKAAKLCQWSARWACFLCGCPLEVEGADYLTQAKPVIFAANHASYVDAIIAASVVPFDTRFMAKKEVFSVPFFRDLLKKLQHIPIDRFDFQKGLAQTKKTEAVLKDGNSIFIFPEGTFSYAAGLRPFKLGAFKLAAETKTPICPLAIQGSRSILRADTYLLRPGRIKILVGKPIYPEGDEWQDIIRLKNQVRDFIATHCGELSLDFTV